MKAIREKRIKMRMSQTRLAELVGVSLRTIQRWEKGTNEPNYIEYQYMRIAVET